MKRLFSKRFHKRLSRYAIAVFNVLLIATVSGVVIHSRSSASSSIDSMLRGSAVEEVSNPLDQLSSADIAVHAARLVQLDEAVAVTEKADSVSAQLAIVPSDTRVVSKPQLVSSAQFTRKDIQTYTAQPGDTVTSLAAKFNVTSDSIKWSNGLQGDAIAPNKVLNIPPRNGIVYEVKSGDTPDSLAQRFRANKDVIIAFNDAEINGLPVGEKILILDGSIAEPVRTTTSSVAGFSFGYTAQYGGNGYDRGYCTWYVANRRAAAGRPIPSNLGHASWWKANAARAGMSIGDAPQVGAIAWEVPRDYYGHVAYVDAVYEDGSMLISEMNVVGWNRESTRVIPASGISRFSFIY